MLFLILRLDGIRLTDDLNCIAIKKNLISISIHIYTQGNMIKFPHKKKIFHMICKFVFQEFILVLPKLKKILKAFQIQLTLK